MSYTPKYQAFIFESYNYDDDTGVAIFNYSFDEQRMFSEKIRLIPNSDYNKEVFERLLQLAHILIGISYYKAFPTKKMIVKTATLTHESADFFSTVYRDGLSQFVYENKLHPDDIATFDVTQNTDVTALDYFGKGVIALQSGGKDSLLLATLLEKNSTPYDAFYCSSVSAYPDILNKLHADNLQVATRTIDLPALLSTREDGGLNGHVPVTYILLSIALLQAALDSKATVLMAVGQEGEEPHAYIDSYAVRHQWSKTWLAEQMFASYVRSIVGPELKVGSPLREYSELKIAKLFAQHCWQRYGSDFSSCNVANYTQGRQNQTLQWCGDCPKCANSFLLFAPWVPASELITTFGKNLFHSAALEKDFKGLLGIDGIEKPFECVGEIDELRMAYQLARTASSEYTLPFTVPDSNFSIDQSGPSQDWARKSIA